MSDEHTEGQQGTAIVAQRSGNLKWIRSTTPATGTTPPGTTNYLFDLAANPGEQDGQNLWPSTLSGPLVTAHNTWNTGNPVTESFNSPRPADDIRAGKPDGYIEAGGTWTVVADGTENSYQGTASGFGGRTLLEGSFYSDAKITSAVKLQDPGQAGIIVRGSGAAEAFDGYVVLLAIPQNGSACAGNAPQPGGGSARVLISKVTNGTGTQVACKNLNLALGTSYTLTVRSVGDTFTVSVNGTQHLNWTDTSGPYTGGRTGLRVTAPVAGQSARALFGTHNAASCTASCP